MANFKSTTDVIKPGFLKRLHFMGNSIEAPVSNPALEFKLNSAQFKASSTFYSIKQFAPHKILIIKFWKLEKIHAGACSGKSL